MYLYFNSKGVLEEVVNDIPTRKDSSNVNHIYVYIDGVAYNTDDKYYPLPDSIESLSTRYQLPDGTITPVALVQGKVQQSIPYDKHRDMKCFKDFYNYEFFDIELPSGVNEDGSQSEMPNVLGQSGLVALTIIEQPVGLALGLVVFNVEQEVGITTDTLITEAQFNYLMGYVAKYDKQVSDIKTLIPDGTTENNKLTNTTIVQDMIDANIPTFTNSTIWTKDFISKVAKVGYAIYLPNNTMYIVENADADNEISIYSIEQTNLTMSSFDIFAGETILQASSYNNKLVKYVDGRIPNITSVVELNDAANKGFVLEQISNVETEIESLGQYAQNTQQELNELKASLYGYVFGEDTANFSKLDISALPSMINNNNNVAYNTRLMLDTIKGRTVKWTQLIDASIFISSRTISGVTFTFNKTNGTITVNGTATEDISQTIMTPLTRLNTNWIPTAYFYLTGCPSGGSESTYWLEWVNMVAKDIGNGVYRKINHNGGFPDTREVYCNPSIHIKSGTTMTNKVFRPQLFNVSNIYGLGKEPKTMADFNKDYPYSIYPYGKQEILTTKVSGIKIRAGYKNLITYFEPTTTISGVTITNNNDGTFTCNGTASADINFRIANAAINMSVDTTFIMGLLKGCPSGGSESTYYLCNTWTNSRDYGQGAISRIERAFPTTIYLDMNVFIKQGTVCNNLVFKPQLINLNDTYGAGNEPTPAQFNQDFPDIDNIPYPEQTISFDEQTLYGINDVQDTLQVVKENNGYKLQKVENIGNVDMGTLTFNKTPVNDDTLPDEYWWSASYPNKFAIFDSYHIAPNLLTPNYYSERSKLITDGENHKLAYNKAISYGGNANYLFMRDTSYTEAADLQTALNGQILYYAKRTPTTTTLATLTKNQVTALFAKGYCVEILGNDDNKIIVRPDLSLNMVIKLIGGNTNE